MGPVSKSTRDVPSSIDGREGKFGVGNLVGIYFASGFEKEDISDTSRASLCVVLTRKVDCNVG